MHIIFVVTIIIIIIFNEANLGICLSDSLTASLTSYAVNLLEQTAKYLFQLYSEVQSILPQNMQTKSGIIVHFKKRTIEIVIEIIISTVLTK